MNYFEEIATQLAICIPELDKTLLMASAPKDINLTEIHSDTRLSITLDWLYDGLIAQGLMEYEEWAEYTGHIPELTSLPKNIIANFDNMPLFDALEQAELDEFLLPELMYFMPYLEYINSQLIPYGKRVVSLTPFENIYMMAVNNDIDALTTLDKLLQKAGLGIDMCDPMSLDDIKRFFKAFPQGLADGLITY